LQSQYVLTHGIHLRLQAVDPRVRGGQSPGLASARGHGVRQMQEVAGQNADEQ
jgi:hypothetical protein